MTVALDSKGIPQARDPMLGSSCSVLPIGSTNSILQQKLSQRRKRPPLIAVWKFPQFPKKRNSLLHSIAVLKSLYMENQMKNEKDLSILGRSS